MGTGYESAVVDNFAAAPGSLHGKKTVFSGVPHDSANHENEERIGCGRSLITLCFLDSGRVLR